MYRLLYECDSSFLWDKCLECIYLLCCMVVACLVFEETVKLFPRASVSFSLLTSSGEGASVSMSSLALGSATLHSTL